MILKLPYIELEIPEFMDVEWALEDKEVAPQVVSITRVAFDPEETDQHNDAAVAMLVGEGKRGPSTASPKTLCRKFA
jgi:hypothetical protein